MIHDEQRTAQIDIQRGPGGRPFDEPDLALDQLEIGPALPPLDGLGAAFAAALDDLPGGMIVLDADGRVAHMNRAARAILGRGDGITIKRSGAIVLASPEATRQLAALLHGVRHGLPHGDAAGGVVRAPRRRGGIPYTMLVSPQPNRLGPGGAIVLIHDPDRALHAPPALLRRVFGLTPREAELVAALVAGVGAAGFAVQAGISLNTVRYHLKSIYAKVGVAGQADLLRTVLSTVAVLGGERHAALWRGAREQRIRKHP